MFKAQVYNTVRRDQGELSPTADAFRRLTRRINHNMGLLNTSRSSNNSSSFRMRRTELSGERYNASRERDQTSNQISGLNSQDFNDSRGQAIRKIGNRQQLSNRRLKYEPSKLLPSQQNGGKNIVENLYMLSNNGKNIQRGRNNANKQSYEPMSPRLHQASGNQLDRRKDEYSRERNNLRSGSHSRQSRLGQRHRSKDLSRLRQNRNEISRQRRNMKFAGEQVRSSQKHLLKKLQQKYLQNIYELKSPRKKQEKKRSEKEIAFEDRRDHNPRKDPNKYNYTNTGNTKNMNAYYFQQPQVSSTSGGSGAVKTLPQSSKFESASQPSLPVNSIASQKQIASKASISPRVHQKNSMQLERPKQKEKNLTDLKEAKRVGKQSRISIKIDKGSNKKEEAIKKKQKIQKAIDQREDEVLLLGSVFLPVESKREEGREWAEDILQRIILHLQCLNIIADYTKQFRKMYENTEQWQVLIFLSYKKFYIERTKVASILRAPSVKKEIEESRFMAESQNPFILPYSRISEEQLTRFRGSRECLALRHQLQAEDIKIRNALRGLYNLYIQKSGQHVNMLDCDNFSQEIYKLMLEEMEGISENLEEQQLIGPTKLRMGKIIRSGLLIAFLNGKYVKNFGQILLHQDTVKIGKRETLRQDCAANLFLEEFKRVLT